MEHVVFYPSSGGTAAFRRVGSLEEATNFVEHLRNSENITEFSVHALTPVPLAFRAYYHVEVPESAEETDAPTPAITDADRSAEWVAEAPVVEPVAFVVPASEADVVDAPPAEVVNAVAEASVEPVAASAEPAVGAGDERPDAVNDEAPSAIPSYVVTAPTDVVEQRSGEPEMAPEAATTEVVPVPSGRRSLGFFAR
jgi:hypothetical protein